MREIKVAWHLICITVSCVDKSSITVSSCQYAGKKTYWHAQGVHVVCVEVEINLQNRCCRQ